METVIDPSAVAADIEARLQGLPVLKTETVRRVRREFSRTLAAAPAREVCGVAVRLLDRASSVPRFVAYELIRHHPAALQSLRAADLARLSRGMDDWAAVDTFACYLAGPAWREHQVPDSLIRRWAGSPNRWWRRAALVSTVPLNSRAQGGRGDTRRTLMVCGTLVTDRDDMVVKALSWALRELAKRDPSAARRFLAKHRGALAPRVEREVGNKLRTGLKNPRARTGAR